LQDHIDSHGAIKAKQLNQTNTANEVLLRSYFQPDDHDNPTFLPELLFFTQDILMKLVSITELQKKRGFNLALDVSIINVKF
jgi:hypothetical protein